MEKSLFIALYIWFSLSPSLTSYSMLLEGHCHRVRIVFQYYHFTDDESAFFVWFLFSCLHSEQWMKTSLSFRARDDVSSLLACRCKKITPLLPNVYFFQNSRECFNNLQFILPEILLFNLKDLRYFLSINFLCFLVSKH